MDIAVSAWSVERVLKSKGLTLEEFISFCVENGVYQVELLDCFWRDADHYKRIKRLMDQKGVSCCSYSITSDLVCREPAYGECIGYIKKSVDIALALDTKCVRIFPGTPKNDIGAEEGYELIKRALAECCRYAAGKKVMLCMENHGLYGGRSESLIRIMNSVGSGSLGVNPDTGNFLLGGEDPLEAFLHLRGKIGNVHFKDFVTGDSGVYPSYDGKKWFTGCVLGKGIVPLSGVVAELKASGYGGCISIEYEGVEEDCMRAVKECIEYTRSIL